MEENIKGNGVMEKNMGKENCIHLVVIGDRGYGLKVKDNNGYKLLTVNSVDIYNYFLIS